MRRHVLPLVLLLSFSSAASAQNTLQKVIGDLLRTTTGTSTPSATATLPRCESVAGQQRTCKVPAGYRAEYVRQLSKTACVPGKTLFVNVADVVVASGCRAEFRLIETTGAGNALPGASANLEVLLTEGLRATLVKPQNEYGSLYDVRVLTAKLLSNTSAVEQVYEGTANSRWGGRTYPLDYTARIDTRNARILNLDYQYKNPNAGSATGSSGAWLDGTALDAEARDALERAITAEYQNRNAGRRVQVVLNTAYKEQAVTRSDYRFNGRYGVSIDDGNWQTYRYSARIFLPRNTVSELDTSASMP